MAEPKPTYTLDQIIHQLTTSWGGGPPPDTNTRTWQYNNVPVGSGDQISYSIGVKQYISPAVPDSLVSFSRASLAGWADMTLMPMETGAAQLAFQLWDDLVPFSMVDVSANSTGQGGNIALNYSWTTPLDPEGVHRTKTDDLTHLGSSGETLFNAAYIWLSSNWPSNNDNGMGIGGYGMSTMEHEIGHALGLSHPANYDANDKVAPTFANSAVYSIDNRQYTIMSYFGYYSNTPGTFTPNGWQQDGATHDPDGGTDSGTILNPQTPMVDDIAAIQSLYGADTTTRSGDTVYGFNCNVTAPAVAYSQYFPWLAESYIYDFSKNPTPIFTIWDGGGNDTLDCSGYSGPQVINLEPGSYSSVDGLVNNIGIAYGCNIEKAVGGSGDDTFYAYGDFHTYDGGPGSNTLDYSFYGLAVQVDLTSDQAFTSDGDEIDISSTLRQVASFTRIENIVGGAESDELTGDGGDNRIDGGTGTDTIHGGDGKDTLIGGGGFDYLYGDGGDDTLVSTYQQSSFVGGLETMDGGTGTDTAYFGSYGGAVQIDLTTGKAYTSDSPDLSSGTLRLVANLTSIENLTGGNYADVLIGDINDNTLDGGGDGRDFPNTAVFHGPRSDYTVTLLANGDLKVADSVAGRDGTDTLKNIQNLRFSDGDVPAAAIGPQAQMQSIADLNVVYADPSTVASGFHFALAGSGANIVFGNAGNDALDASGASDSLAILLLYGGDGSDTLIAPNDGSYTMDGGPGDDTAVFAGNQSDYTVNGSPFGTTFDNIPVPWLSWAIVTDRSTGDTYWLRRVEHLQFADGTIDTPGQPPGDDFTDVLSLDSSNPPASIGSDIHNVYVDDSHGPNPVHLNLAGTNVNLAYGGLGNDIFDASGTSSRVVLEGEFGNDTLIGGAGGDTLGGDESTPGGGNDWLDGGAGNDFLFGGNGDDTFVFRPGSDMDTVEDFDQAQSDSGDLVHSNDHDVIRFEGGLFASFDALVASGDMTQSGANVIINYGATDQVTIWSVSLSQFSANDFVFVNSTPTLSGVAATVAFTAGQPVTLSPSLTVSDSDNSNLASATVAIGGGTFKNDGDVLAATTTGTNITASYDSATETLTLSGSDTLTHYQQVLDSVTFTSTSPNPTNYGLNPTRTITWSVDDGGAMNNVSASASTTVNITATPPVNTPASVTVSNLVATHGQTFTAAQLYTAGDTDGDDIPQVEFWNTGGGGGHFVLNGVAQATNQGIFVDESQLSQLTYQSGTGKDTLYVRANDGTQWSAWSQSFTVTAPPINSPPVVTRSNANVNVGHATVAATSLFTASDADGDAIVQYDFFDSGQAGGHWLLNGVAQPNNQILSFSASQLSQITYKGGAGTETLWERASDGIQYGAWVSLNATGTETAPVVTAVSPNVNVSSNPFSATSLFTATDADSDAIVQYDFWDGGQAGGHWFLNGVALPNNQENFVSAAQLSQVTYSGGSGTETIYERASDGVLYSAWVAVNATGTETAPVVAPTRASFVVSFNSSFAASTLFTVYDQHGDSITQYDFWDNGAGGGHWSINGAAQGSAQEILVNASQLSQVTYTPGVGTDTLYVRANDGTTWGAWTNPGFTATDAAPVSTPVHSLVSGVSSATYAFNDLFTVSDADGDAPAIYDLWDSGTGGGHWFVNGVQQGSNQEIPVNASQISQVTYHAGSGTETLYMRASDGLHFGAWTSGVTVISAPVANPNQSAFILSHTQSVAASTMFAATDADNDAITQYDFWDNGAGGGHWSINSLIQASNHEIIVNASQLPLVTYTPGAGTDTLYMRVSDATGFGPWSQAFTATDAAPVSAWNTSSLVASTGQTFAASNLFTAADADGDDVAQYDFWDSGAGGGHWSVGNSVKGSNQDIVVNASQLSQVTYTAGTGTDALYVRANDGLQWAPWSNAFTASGGTQPRSVSVPAGGAVEIATAASSTNASFASNTGALKLDDSQHYAGTVAGLVGQDALDLADINFINDVTTNATLMNATSVGGTLHVTDGTNIANIALLGNYMASVFFTASDGHGGTAVYDLAMLGGSQPLVTPPHP